MTTIFEACGRQYRVSEGDVIAIEKMDKKENDSIEFSNVLYIKDNDNVVIGNPYIKNAMIKATVLGNQKEKKKIVFKFKKRKGYTRLKGHRQPYTMIKIEKIVSKSA